MSGAADNGGVGSLEFNPSPPHSKAAWLDGGPSAVTVCRRHEESAAAAAETIKSRFFYPLSWHRRGACLFFNGDRICSDLPPVPQGGPRESAGIEGGA